MEVVREKLKKQEQEAWLETTKNLIKKDQNNDYLMIATSMEEESNNKQCKI